MHDVNDVWRYPRHIAHRCGGALAPENTLAGLQIAARLGFRAVEFDVMLSADGQALVIHDETLERTTDGQGCVAQQSWAQLADLDAGQRHHRAFAGEPLATFEQMLQGCQTLGLAANVEIKPATGHDEATGRKVAQIAAEFVAAGKLKASLILLSSFSEAALYASHVLAPQFMKALLVEKIPMDWAARLQRLGGQALHCDAAQLSVEQIKAVTAAVPLACYTVNQVLDAECLFAQGVTAIFTDRLDLFDPLAV